LAQFTVASSSVAVAAVRFIPVRRSRALDAACDRWSCDIATNAANGCASRSANDGAADSANRTVPQPLLRLQLPDN
jgi:hypothetical protein